MKAIKTVLILVTTIAIFAICAIGAYNYGYHAAIEEAKLSSITEEQFTLTFNGEEHVYHSTIGGETMEDAFNDGYQQAIEDAELVESDENGYTLSFNGEVNWYTFD